MSFLSLKVYSESYEDTYVTAFERERERARARERQRDRETEIENGLLSGGLVEGQEGEEEAGAHHRVQAPKRKTRPRGNDFF
jgi:hypothetical protein